MKDTRKKTGDAGEAKAVELLRKKGYVILAKNYRFRRGEIDIIAKKDGMIAFVEVKTRKSKDFGPPESFVSPRQQQLIMDAATEFTLQEGWEGMIRFDIISIIPDREIIHFEDAFY